MGLILWSYQRTISKKKLELEGIVNVGNLLTSHSLTNTFFKMDYDTFDTDIFSEINDMPGEIYDVIEYKEEGEDDKKFDVEGYLNGKIDY